MSDNSVRDAAMRTAKATYVTEDYDALDNVPIGRIKRRCGNCQWWTGENQSPFGAHPDDHYKQCQWPRPVLPFWASIDEGSDHADWTEANDGSRPGQRPCPTWKAQTLTDASHE